MKSGKSKPTSLQLTGDRASVPVLLAGHLLPGPPGHQERCKWSRCLAPGKGLGESNLEDRLVLRDPVTSIHPHEEADSLRKAGCLQATVLRLICMSESLEDAETVQAQTILDQQSYSLQGGMLASVCGCPQAAGVFRDCCSQVSFGEGLARWHSTSLLSKDINFYRKTMKTVFL